MELGIIALGMGFSSIIRNSVGVDESEAESMNGFICEFCSFENPEGEVFCNSNYSLEGDDEEEYVFEKDVATKHKKTKFESHRSGNYSSSFLAAF